MHSGWGTWDSSWAWSGALFAITIAFHASGVVLITHMLVWFRAADKTGRLDNQSTPLRSIVLIVAVALCLSILHAIEAMIWAVAYVELGAFSSPAVAALYSVDSMTTRGSGGLPVAQNWAMMGATEAGNGMLLFGISTAYLFAVMHGLWRKHLFAD